MVQLGSSQTFLSFGTLLSLCCSPCVYSFVLLQTNMMPPRLDCSTYQHHNTQLFVSSSKVDQQETVNTASTDVASSSDIIITVPRHYEGEVAFGSSYPSPLHSIHIQSCLTTDQAATCLQMAQDFASATGSFDEPDTFRHETYSTCDFAIEDCTSLERYLDEIQFHEQIFEKLSQAYGVSVKDMEYIDCFCAHYRAHTNETSTRKTMDRLEPHRDGSLLSYTVLLTPPDAFEGGGTSFDALRDEVPSGGVLHPNGVIRPSKAGDCTLHSGKLLHGADIITKGERTVLVGFVDVAEHCQRPKALAHACRDFGRMDAALYRHKRQLQQTNGGVKPGWKIRTSRWLPKKTKSHISDGYCPSFPSASARADPEYQRRKKLEAEDVLLRSILLPKEEQSTDDFLGRDVTTL